MFAMKAIVLVLLAAPITAEAAQDATRVAINAHEGRAVRLEEKIRQSSGMGSLLRREALETVSLSVAAAPANLPPTAEDVPLQSCDTIMKGDAPSEPWKAQQREAATPLCAHPDLRQHMEVYLDSRFKEHYKRIFTDPDGWAPEAYVNFIKVNKPRTYYGNLTEGLVDSVHRFSKKPIIVVNFGNVAPPELTPERFPRLVLLHAHSVTVHSVSFNFNKLLAILLAKVKTGMSADADTMIGPHADKLFARTNEEITEKYPYPMLPTHYLDRDPDNAPKPGEHRDTYFPFEQCKGCPKPTMRWGQAHPTWNYWAFPFVGRWLSAKLTKKIEHGVYTSNIGEDEDLLNVGLWAENATKAWCMFQYMGTSWVWENFLPQSAPGPAPFWSDPARYPKGVPLAFYMSHAEQKIEKVYKAMDMLQNAGNKVWNATELSPYYHNGKFYQTFAALKADDPGLRCMF